MIPAVDPQSLLELGRDLDRKGANGLLLSGGCGRDGKLPLGPYLGTLALLKRETGLIINVHTGLLDPEDAGVLVDVAPDCYSVDVVQDETAIRETLHLGVGPAAYRQTLSNLISCGAKHVVPHICIGLSETSEGEYSALRMIQDFSIAALVVLVLSPTKGTPLEKRPCVDDARVVGFVEEATNRLTCPVLLGCMRPRGNWKLEAKCIDAGIAGIAVPSRRTTSWARDRGFDVEVREICCALYR